MDASTLVLFVIGFGLLIGGAELLVRGASQLAAAGGISPLIIGLTVVAFGTSSPELAVSVQSALAGQADIALGNVIGSNVFNVLFILGISAVITPLVVAQQLVRLDVPIMISASVLALILALDGRIGRVDGALLFAGMVAYIAFSIYQSRRESRQVQAEYAEDGSGAGERAGMHSVAQQIGMVVVGLGLLVLGARWLVNGAVTIAQMLGVSELVIGLTIVAAGTSLPEIATSIIAALRGQRDIAVGNAIGSNIFNILSVLGLTALVAPNGIAVASSTLTFDMPVMIAVALACLPIFFTGYVIARWEGWLFLGYYVAYTLFVLLAAAQHDTLPVFSAALGWFVLPLTIVTLVVLAGRAWRQQQHTSADGTD